MTRNALNLHKDGKCRCCWCGDDALYQAYHDEEWGVPEHDDRALFEKLILDGFQAGLSWITILRKRENFRKAFVGFDPVKIASFNDTDIERLMQDAGIVRNRSKIVSTVKSAKVWLEIQEKESFSRYLWDFVGGETIQNDLENLTDIPTQSAESVAMSKDLKKRGFNFCGPTITYAFMQAVGMVNDHFTGCFRYQECRDIALNNNKPEILL